jgi:AraC-like DNA-binding protein
MQANGAQASQPTPAIVKFSSDVVPERERLAFFVEHYARQLHRVETAPLPGHQFQFETSVRRLPGLGVSWSQNSPDWARRTKSMAADGSDLVPLQMVGCDLLLKTAGREATVRPGDAVAYWDCEAWEGTLPTGGHIVSVVLERKRISPLVCDLTACLGRIVTKNTPALRLLKQYVAILKDESEIATPDLEKVCVDHIYDLVALTLGATRDATESAKHGGVAAARFQAIKKFIAENLADGLSVDLVAAQHRISSRYLQKLFEDNGTSFTEFVREQRLLCAYRLLSDARFDCKRIGEIALYAGFNDFSYFDRLFRRRFELSPRDVRERSLSESD